MLLAINFKKDRIKANFKIKFIALTLGNVTIDFQKDRIEFNVKIKFIALTLRIVIINFQKGRIYRVEFKN